MSSASFDMDHCTPVGSPGVYYSVACANVAGLRKVLMLGYDSPACVDRPFITIAPSVPFSEGACIVLNATTATSLSASYARVYCDTSSKPLHPGIVAAIIIGAVIVSAFSCILLASCLGLPCVPQFLRFSCCPNGLSKITPNVSAIIANVSRGHHSRGNSRGNAMLGTTVGGTTTGPTGGGGTQTSTRT